MRLVLLALLLGACEEPSGPRPLAQHEVTAAGPLLTSDGKLREPGWAQRQLFSWDAALVHDKTKLRQWDFFTISNESAAVNLTLTDLGFVQLASVGVVDFATSAKHEARLFKGSGTDQFTLSPAVEGSASLQADGAATPALRFVTTADRTDVTIDIPESLLGEAAQGSFTIQRRPQMPYLSLATPFTEDPFQFFFEQKIAGMTADGSVTVGTGSWTFSGAEAVMDWGRGQWPQQVTWRWGGGSGTAGGSSVALNLGEGFGDDTSGTENLLVYGDVAHKLGRVSWKHTAGDPMQDWTFASSDGRVALVLHPTAQEIGGLDFGSKFSKLEKAYGTFSGTVALDDGTKLTLDGVAGFAEEQKLAW
jgi:hypothetical protein